MEDYKKGDLQSAALKWEQAYRSIKISPSSEAALNAYLVACAYYQLNMYNEVRYWALKAKEDAEDPETIRYLVDAIDILLLDIQVMSGNYHEALDRETVLLRDISLKKQTAENELLINAYSKLLVSLDTMLGESYLGVGDTDKAESYFQKVAELRATIDYSLNTEFELRKYEERLKNDLAAVEARREPPLLITSIEFPHHENVYPNKILDAGETVEILIKVENQGKGTARDVKLMFSTEGNGFIVPHSNEIGTIHPGGSKEVIIPVSGSLDLKDGEASITVETKEKRGYDAKKQKRAFDTARLKRPNIQIKSVRIQDGTSGLAAGNGNGVIENGETVEFHVIMDNNGEGGAHGVVLSLEELLSPGTVVIQKESDIGEIGVGETVKGNVIIRVPRNLQSTKVQAKFKIKEKDRKAAYAEKTMTFTGGTLKPELISRVTWNDASIGEAQGNGNGVWENGETIEGMLTIVNEGSLDAEGVEVALDTTGGGVNLQRRQFRIGRLGRGQTSEPVRAVITIPRTYNRKDITIEAVIKQQEFPEKHESFALDVAIRQPRLIVVQRLLNLSSPEGNTIGSITQGEVAKLEVRVKNIGDMDAKGVKVLVSSERPEIRLDESNKTFNVGAITAGQTSEGFIIPVRVLRSAPVGVGSISAKVYQDEFPEVIQVGKLMIMEEGAEVVKVVGEAARPLRPVLSAPAVAAPPVYMVSISPAESVTEDYFDLMWDELAEITHLEVTVNGKLIPKQKDTDRGIGLSMKGKDKRQQIRVPLSPGQNSIIVTAYDLNNKEWKLDPIIVNRLSEHGDYYALLIGVNQYNNWPKLTTAVKDIEELRNVLEKQYGFAAHRIKSVRDREATREGIIEAFEWLIKNTSEEDNVLVYYAGHGELDEVAGYWVPVDAKLDKKAAYISNSTIREHIAAIKAKHVYLIADSCFSGSLFAGLSRSKPAVINDRYYKEAYNRKSRQAITSGGKEPVSDGGKDGHSIFAFHLLKTLRDNKEQYITATELFNKIAIPVANNSKQTPISQPIKDVQDEGGEFVFGLGGHLP